MATKLVTESVWREIQAMARRTRRRRQAAIAYLGRDGADLLAPFGPGDCLVVNAGRDALASGATNPDALSELVERGVEVSSCDWLHAKVIVIANTAIVGSNNASQRSAGKLKEAALITTDPQAVADARAFIDALSPIEPVDDTFLLAAHALYRQPPPSRQHQGTTPTIRQGDRVFIMIQEPSDPPPATKRVLDRSMRAQERKMPADSDFSVDYTWQRYPAGQAPPALRHRDWLISGEPPSPDHPEGILYPPMEYLATVDEQVGSERARADYWRFYNTLDAYDLTDARAQTMAHNGTRLPKATPWSQIHSPKAIAALFDLWGLEPGANDGPQDR